MSRRALGTAALAAGLLTTGLVPFLGSAHAAACPTWTDPADDAKPNHIGIPLNDANLDIVSTTLTTSGSNVVAKVTVKDLANGFSDIGDRFSVQFDVAGAKLRLLADRDLNGERASVDNIQGAVSGAATAVWDDAKNVVTITAAQAEVDKAAGSPTKGQESAVKSSGSGIRYGADDLYPYDTSTAPADMTYAVGVACTGGGTPEPTPSPTGPTTPPGAQPEGYPRAGCDTFTDVKGDGGIDAPLSNASGPVAQGPNDVDLDLTGVVFGTTPTEVVAFVRVDDLKAAPSNGNGHQFDVSFTHNAKVINVYAQQYDAVVKAQRDAINATTVLSAIPDAGGKVGTTYNKDLKVTAAFDQANNVVKLTLTRASLEAVAGKPAPNGTVVTAVAGASRLILPNGGFNTADVVQATAVADQVFTFGNSPCFSAPAAVLTNVGKTTVQYGDSAAVAAKLTNAAGAALGGKRVTFAIGSKSVSATTGSDGVAKASLNPGLVAGTYSLVTTFAGDSSASEVSLTKPFTVTAEKTRIVLSVAKSGSSRTVTAKLLDDDGRPVAGQTIVWYVNGKKVSSSKTTSAGVAVFKTAKPTQTVKAVYAGLSKKYLGSTASTKV